MRKQERQEEKRQRDTELRDWAEEKLARTPDASRQMQNEPSADIIHELQVHQIELEMQNEELRRTQLALEESRCKYIDLYDFAPVGYFILTDKSLIAEVNLTGAGLLGVPRRKLTNGRFRRYVAPEDQGLWDHHLLSVLKGEEKQTCDLLLRRADGSTFPAHLESVRLTVQDGVPMIRTAVSDITEHKKSEAAQLRMTQLQSLGLVAAGMAHDFNNLLQGLLANISIAKLHLKPDDRSYKFLEEAENIYESARQLTGKLLTFTKGGEPVRTFFDINSLIREWSGCGLNGSPVACNLQIPATDYLVEADEAQIRQVMQNLLINAREAMPAGGAVTIRTERISLDEKTSLAFAKGLYVRISVADQGRGIPKENLERVFEPYFSTKDQGVQKGMGLGLAICQSIIERHGGYITVESSAEEGTTFTLYLPLAEKEVPLTQ